MIRISTNDGPVPHDVLTFSGGEVQVRLTERQAAAGPFFIRADLTDSAAIMELILLTDALRRRYGDDADLRLTCPYLPYARQDRVCAPGEALSLRVMCDLINAQRYREVEVWDAHSDVALALLDRAHSVPQEAFVSRISFGSEAQIIAPDAGAMKKIAAVSKVTGLPYIRADKTRDAATGEITGTQLYAPMGGDWDALIVDDICDGGRTFIELAKVIRQHTKGSIVLYVTHGIFSRGLDVFDGLIDRVYTANAFPGAAPHPLLTEV